MVRNDTSICIRIDKELLEKFKQCAQKDRKSLSMWIRDVCEDYMLKQEKM